MFRYCDLQREIRLFSKNGVEVGTVGDSFLHQRIPYIFVGKKKGYQMIVQGAMHAREHLTALLVVCLAKYLVKNPQLPLFGGIYFVPMVNPDGVRLCQEGTEWITSPSVVKNLVNANGNSEDFSLWKANAQGVDLNVNFDANWGKGQSNVFEPNSQNYVGKLPFCAPESASLRTFTQLVQPCVTLSYHLKGEEIYWEFGQKSHRRFRDEALANAIAKVTGYTPKLTPNSAGGYKDWCVQKLKIPSFTIEVGSDNFPHPFPYSQFENILRQNLDLPRKLLNTVGKQLHDLKKLGVGWIYNC